MAQLQRYVENGGHVLMTFKSGFANEDSAVRWVRAPGPLREAAGFSYQEFSNLDHPLALKDDPLHAGAENKVSYWAEFLMPDNAKAVATYERTLVSPRTRFDHWIEGDAQALSPQEKEQRFVAA